VNVLRRRWRVVALLTVLALAGTLGGLVAGGRSSAATATVRIPGTPDDLQYTDRLTNTYKRIAESAPIRAEVRRRVGGGAALDLSATPVPNTELMELTARAHTPDLAQRAANTLATVLVSQVRADAREDRSAARAGLASQLAASERRLLRLRRELAGATDRARRTELAERLRVGELAHHALAAQAVTGLDGRDVRNVVSISQRATPSAGQWRSAAGKIAVGLVLGLLAGVGLAFLLERRKPQLDTLEEIERAAGASVLTTIPTFHTDTAGRDGRPRPVHSMPVLPTPLRPALNGASVPHAAFADLRARLLSDETVSGPLRRNFDGRPRADRRPCRTLLVTSAKEGDGKSTVAGNPAVALSRAQHRVLLVDADLRHPTLHRYFGLSNDHGLSELLLASRKLGHDGCHAETATTPLPKLSVLPGGPRAAEAAELLASARMVDVMAKLKPDYDFVVIDSPGIATTSDAAAVVPTADAVIFVVGGTPVGDDTIQGARRQLDGWGARAVGIVVNRCAARTGPQGIAS
jgi:polysaccharide biosynthesis transport protein